MKIQTVADWKEAESLLCPGDKFGLWADDFSGEAIEWGTQVKGEVLPLCHFGNIYGWVNGVLQTIEADGKYVCARHLFSDYMYRVAEGHARLYIFRPNPPLTTQELQNEMDFWSADANDPYNGWENFWFGAWGAVSKVSPGLGSWLSSHLTNPAYKSASMVCSQEVIACDEKNPRIINPIIADKPLANMTPIELGIRITRTCPLILTLQNT